MRYTDVFNGDADGLIARHQVRLAFPVDPTLLTLVTGVKRDIALVSRVRAEAGDVVSVFDVSFDRNADAIERLLMGGVEVLYVDHHRADRLRPHPRLTAHIDTAASVCSSLLADGLVQGRFRPWAIAAAFGDNLTSVATDLALSYGLRADQSARLRELGECLNYNAYGDSVADLFFHPADLAGRMAAYACPFAFMEGEGVLSTLRAGFAADMEAARAVAPRFVSERVGVFQLPDAPWARRVSGVFANEVANLRAARAHAVLTPAAGGGLTVSIRAPSSHPHGADQVAAQFGGGGRLAAAGVEGLPEEAVEGLIAALVARYGGS
ncbi:MAG: hypothetical protein JNM52_00870 [Betaproteobacteria bacterium]|nr:hypothetical protein [Betaproteobacteria bacterium]